MVCKYGHSCSSEFFLGVLGFIFLCFQLYNTMISETKQFLYEFGSCFCGGGLSFWFGFGFVRQGFSV